MNKETLEWVITKPFDAHLHIRDGAAMASVVGHSAAQMDGAIIMPNLSPPVTNLACALLYRETIYNALPRDTSFTAWMTLYLTDNTTPEEVHEAWEHGWVKAVKWYPAGVTTNAEHGVTSTENIYPVLEQMQKDGMPLCVHGESPNVEVDPFDREALWYRTVMVSVRRDFPTLRIVCEHITTEEAVQFVESSPGHVVATITPQHLMFDRRELFRGGVRPHAYCLPILKRERHRLALVRAATSGSSKFFLGTDSAPHDQTKKETGCGCAGCFTAPYAVEMYATVFAKEHAWDKFEAFASWYGPNFYGIPRSRERVRLVQKPQVIPPSYPFGNGVVVPLLAGETLDWQLEAAV